jgi:quercetin dioxygenase-like cupin family protein
MAERLKITPHESIEIRSAGPELFEVEVTYAPGGRPPPKHYHPLQDEHFEVLAGKLRTRIEGDDRTLGPGEQIDIPRGAVHQLWNSGTEPARALWQTSPAGRTEQWFRAIDALHREGRVNRDGMPGPLAFGVLLSEYDDVFRLAGPGLVLRPVVGLLGMIGRARGYSAA